MSTDDERKRQGKRLAQLRSQAGYRSARAAALELGWPESTYRAHEAGARTIGADDAERYAARFGAGSAQWILFGDGLAPPASSAPTRRPDTFRPQITPGADLVSREAMLPIYAAAMGGAGHLIVTFDPVQRVKMPSILEGVMNAYGILITGESMEPEFRPGDMALINPHLQPMRDETHVFYDHPPDGEAEAMVKRLVGWTDEKWKLRQFNPALDFDEDRADWPTCHRVVGKYNRR
jgi:phage repressor protein C with HTH and peptisase S24 domain